MLPSSARLTLPSDFARTTKSGIRVTSKNFVGYLYIQPASNNSLTSEVGARAGLIIGKSVGGSVRRHRVSRQIRHALAPTLKNFPNGSLLVIRGLKAERDEQQNEDIPGEITALTVRLIEKAAKRMASA